MILISHRGNTKGPNKEKENHPDYIEKALRKNYDVEIDIWVNSKVWLGHDEPQYECNFSFLMNNYKKLWIHCKNLEALDLLDHFQVFNYFWHQKDDFTLTSKNFIWTYPEKNVCSRSVLVVENAKKYTGPDCFGLCSDYIE